MRIASLALLVVFTACAAPQPASRPKSVILFIGDGMGISQITLGRLAKAGTDGKLAIDAFPVTGLVTTHSTEWVTDSAAAATALASGEKTKNFMIGVDPGMRKLTSILQRARDKGYATGLVTTAKITHATPAPFASHVLLRNDEALIAKQYASSGVDVLMGGGAMFFPSDLVAEYSLKGYHVVRNREEMKTCASTKILGLFAEEHMPYVLDRSAECPSLAEMTKKAIGAMGGRPFFLMIEGARIDMACHASDAVSSAYEMVDFDEAVQAAIETVRDDTLIVVTADHATGGLAIGEKAQTRWLAGAKVKASAEKIDRLVRPDLEQPGDGAALRAALKEWTGIEDATDEEIAAYTALKGKYDPEVRIGEIISRRVGCSFVPLDYRLIQPDLTHGHDGAMVPVYARGPGAERFGGTLDNTDIPKRIRELANW